MESVSITVAYHAEAPHPTVTAAYRAICNVGPSGDRPDGFEAYDSDGGFPDRNLAYCELSAFRAGLCSSDAEWVGLTHYRRLFSGLPNVGDADRYPAFRRLRSFDWAEPARYGADWDRLRSHLPDRAFATAPALDVRRLGYSTLLEQYVDAHPIAQVRHTSAVLARLAPAPLAFEDYLAKARRFRPFNMLLARREQVERYTAVLWPALEDAWEHLPHPEGTYARRWPGFLAERILNYWVDVLDGGPQQEARELPLMLLHEASIVNSAAPAQGRVVGRARPKSKIIAAAALSRLSAPVMRPIATFERSRARHAAA